jgi:signal transduction histidine kinase
LKPRLSLAFQLALLTVAAVAVSTAVWGTAARALWRRFLAPEAAHWAFRSADDLSTLLAPAIEGGMKGPAARSAEKWVERVRSEPWVSGLAVYAADKRTVLVAPDGEPPAADLSIPSAVRSSDGRNIGWVRLWYSAAKYEQHLWRSVRYGIWILGALIGFAVGGAVYGLCWLLVLRPVRQVVAHRRLAPSPDGRPPAGRDAEAPVPAEPRREDAPSGFSELGTLIRRFRQMEHRLEESEENLDVLLAASRSMASDLDVQEIYDRVLDLVWRRLDRESCLIWLRDPDGLLRVKHFRNFPPEWVKRLRLRGGEGGAGRAIDGHEPVFDRELPEYAAVAKELGEPPLEARAAVHFPINIDGRGHGVLSAFARDAGFFQEDRVRMIQSLLDYLSVSVRGARLFERMQDFSRRKDFEISSTAHELERTNHRLIQRVRELRALYEVAQHSGDRAGAAEVAAKALEHARDLLEAERAGVFLLDTAGAAFSPFPAVPDAPSVAAEAAGDWRDRLSAGECVSLDKPEDVRRLLPGWDDKKSALAAPMLTGEGLLGYLAVAGKRRPPFEEEDRRVLSLLGRHLSETVLNARLRDERERRIRDLTTLAEVFSVLSGEPDLAKTLRETARVVAEAMGADVCVFLLYDEKTQELVAQPGAHGLPADQESRLYRIPLGDTSSTTVRVFVSGEPVLTVDAQIDPSVSPQYALLWKTRSLLAVPLSVEKRCIGVLRLGHKEPGRFTTDHLRLAALVAEQAAAIVQNARLYRQVQASVAELERLNRVKTEFLSMVSHELRTPITSINGFVGIVLGRSIGPLTEKQERFLGLVKQSVLRLSILIDDLLDTSRIESGRVSLQPEWTAVAEILRQTQRDHAPGAQNRKLDISVELPEELPPVYADPHRVRQVVDNLVTNAMKFTPEGGKVVLAARRQDDGVIVSVRDTGIGIPSAEREKVFEKFYQVKTEGVVRSHRGLGLGLAICRSFVEMHGGRIWVVSEPGKGSEFLFTLPRGSEKTAAAPADASARGPSVERRYNQEGA